MVIGFFFMAPKGEIKAFVEGGETVCCFSKT
jgi:hypothetical protein